jgi:uncharacterized protein (DUF433 family)
MSTARADVSHGHVAFDDKGVPIIAGTTMKVVELIMAHQAHGWSPEELRFQYPHLSLGQIDSALAYYRDHKEQLDDDIERRSGVVEQARRVVEQARREAGASPISEKLRRE